MLFRKQGNNAYIFPGLALARVPLAPLIYFPPFGFDTFFFLQ